MQQRLRRGVFASIRMAYRIKTGQIFWASDALSALLFTELHYTDPNNAGNPSLNAERAWSYEAKTEAHVWKHHIRTHLRRESNLVDYIRRTNASVASAKSGKNTHLGRNSQPILPALE